MHQTIDTGSQTHKNTKIGNRLDRTLDLVSALSLRGKLLPRVGLALLHAQADAALVFINFQHHHFHFVAQRHNFVGCSVLVGPVHLGNVHQAFDAGLQLDKRAVVGNIGHLAEQAGLGRIAACHTQPRVITHLFETQADTVFLCIKLEYLGCELLTGMHHFRGVTHTAPRHVGDVQQPVDAPQIHKCAVFGDVLDHTIDDRALPQGFQQLGTFLAHAGLQHGAAGQHHVVALAIQLDDLELHSLVFVGSQILGRTGVHQRTRQEGADAVDQHGQAALDLSSGGSADEIAGLERLFQAQPRGQAFGSIAREDGFAKAIFGAADGNRHKVASLDFDFALVIFKFLDRDVCFGLQPCVDHDVAVLHTHHFGSDDFTCAHFSVLQGFFKQGGKRFRHEISCLLPGTGLHHCSAPVGNRGWLQQEPQHVFTTYKSTFLPEHLLQRNSHGRKEKEGGTKPVRRNRRSTLRHKRPFILPPLQHLLHRCGNIKGRVIQQQGIRRRMQGGDRTTAVTHIPSL